MYQVLLVGKYGHHEGTAASDRLFGVSLIPSNSAKSTKTCRVRGVADIYEQFDCPDNKNPEVVERPRLLEQALVSSFTLLLGDDEKVASTQEDAVLRYVRLPDAKREDSLREGLRK